MKDLIQIEFHDKLYIGDPCYIVDTDFYDNVWGKKHNYKDGNIENVMGVIGTGVGDGCFDSNIHFNFPVDSGTLSIVDGSSEHAQISFAKGVYTINGSGKATIYKNSKNIFVDILFNDGTLKTVDINIQ